MLTELWLDVIQVQGRRARDPGQIDPGRVRQVPSDLERHPGDPASQARLHVTHLGNLVIRQSPPDLCRADGQLAGAERGRARSQNGGLVVDDP